MPDQLLENSNIAEYIHDMAVELHVLACSRNLNTLSYLLSQCVMESGRISESESINEHVEAPGNSRAPSEINPA